MFSTIPSIGISVLRQNDNSFLTSSKAICCGVVTSIAPSQEHSLKLTYNYSYAYKNACYFISLYT